MMNISKHGNCSSSVDFLRVIDQASFFELFIHTVLCICVHICIYMYIHQENNDVW